MKKNRCFVIALLLCMLPLAAFAKVNVEEVMAHTSTAMNRQLRANVQAQAHVTLPQGGIKEVYTYRVSFLEDFSQIPLESLTQSPVTSQIEEKGQCSLAKGAYTPPSFTYYFENGKELTAVPGVIQYGQDKEGKKYSQLFNYSSGWLEDTRPKNLPFMTMEEAAVKAQNLLAAWGLTQPRIVGVYALDIEDIMERNALMTQGSDSMGIDIFENPALENQAYYVVLNTLFEGEPVLDWEKSYICINQKGIAAMEIFLAAVGEEEKKSTHLDILSPWEALEVFAAEKEESGAYYILTGLTLGYKKDIKGEDTYSPHWLVEYQIDLIKSKNGGITKEGLKQGKSAVFRAYVNALTGEMFDRY